jgi:hypothetical protein
MYVYIIDISIVNIIILVDNENGSFDANFVYKERIPKSRRSAFHKHIKISHQVLHCVMYTL